MRKAQADYSAIDAALLPHQRMTLQEYAAARGSSHWYAEPLCCAMAITLVVSNAFIHGKRNGQSERQIVARLVLDYDLDIDTLQRQRRYVRRRSSPE